MKIYISGPMSGITGNNFPAFFAAEEALKKLGFEAVNPARQTPKKTYAEYMRQDITDLLTCDGVCLLPRYEDSNGAMLEYNIANNIDLEIRSLEGWSQK